VDFDTNATAEKGLHVWDLSWQRLSPLHDRRLGKGRHRNDGCPAEHNCALSIRHRCAGLGTDVSRGT
jgi:hypothetical protein